MTLSGRRLDPLWLAAPGLLLLLGLLIGPVLQLLAVSLDDPDGGGFTLAAYQRAFGVRVYIRVISNTFVIALQVMACCLVLGYPLAYWLSTLPKRRQRMMSLLVLLPFWTSALVKTYGPPRLQAISRPGLISLRQRIRSQGTALAKMEIRASRSS